MSATEAAAVLRQVRGLVAAGQADRVPDGELLERFALRHEEAAFEALVRRHGPLVWGVCRRVLRSPHDAEDAFQATFLVLAQKAASVGRRGSLGGWLHRVAFHAALKARVRAANSRRAGSVGDRREPGSTPDPLAEVTGRELLAVLDEELARLPEKYRAPLVLCYLQGKTCDEAARDLRRSVRTLKRHLELGRNRLRARLTRRGLELPAVLPTAGSAGVPPALVETAVRLVTLSPGHLAALSSSRLAAGVLRGMTLAKLQGAAAVLAAVILTVGAFALARPDPSLALRAGEDSVAGASGLSGTSPARGGGESAAAAEEPGTMTVSGRVLDTAGKPVAGAEVALVANGWDFAAQGYSVLKKGSADGDGRFSLTGPRFSSGAGLVLAARPGYGLAQRALDPEADRQEATLTLPPEQPLRGRLLDLQGQPAGGVVVWVMRIGARDDPSLSLWEPADRPPLWPESARSDPEGRFTIAGLPRNTAVTLLVQSDTIAWQPLHLPADNGAKEKSWTLAPGRLLEGTVVHADTGRPAANARVSIKPAGITGRTDATGRFKLSLPAVTQANLPPLMVYPAEGEPYLAVRQEVVWPRGAVKHAVEIKVPRGVLVRGRVTEAGSGRPVAGAGVQFVPREAGNPNPLPNVLTGYQHLAASGPDGSFQIAVLPGGGHLLVSGPGRDFISEEVADRVLRTGKPGGYRIPADGLVPLELAPGSGPKEVAVTLRRGVTVRGRLLDPEGKPVAHAVMVCRLLHTAVPSLFHVEVQGGAFALHGCDPARDYPVSFLDAENDWGASVTLSGKGAGTPVTVRLAPCGRATFRLVDPEGKPRKNHPLRSLILKVVVTPGPDLEEAYRKGLLAGDEEFADNLLSRKERVARKGLRSDGEGRVTFSGLIPGATYRLSALEPEKGDVLKKEFRAPSGKTLDLGEVPLSAR
jgi:RNA polymerase sigma factor (sigma-70 family)